MQTVISNEQLDLFKSLFSTRTDVYAKFWTNFKTKKLGMLQSIRTFRLLRR